jgi:hypothetical protein
MLLEVHYADEYIGLSSSPMWIVLLGGVYVAEPPNLMPSQGYSSFIRH